MRSGRPPVICIIGRKNAGKTQLTVALGAELNRRGYRVMTAKHAHGFHVDQPGRDSWRHRHEGGAVRTALASPSDFAVVGHWPSEEMPLSELVDRFLWDADVVLAEGFKSAPEPKVEVFRDARGSDPMFDPGEEGSSGTVALVTDRTPLEVPIPVFDLGSESHVSDLADFLEDRFMKGRGKP